MTSDFIAGMLLALALVLTGFVAGAVWSYLHVGEPEQPSAIQLPEPDLPDLPGGWTIADEEAARHLHWDSVRSDVGSSA